MKNVHKKARDLLRRYNTQDPWELANCIGIIVIRYPFRNLRGMYFSMKGRKFAAINSNLSIEKQNNTLLHEIGHAYLHPELNYFSINNRDEILESLRVRPPFLLKSWPPISYLKKI